MNNTSSSSRPLNTVFNHGVVNSLVDERILASGLMHSVFDDWSSDAKLELPYDVVLSQSERNQDERTIMCVTEGGCLVYIRVRRGRVSCQVHAGSRQRAEALLGDIRGLLPEADRQRESQVAVTFWSVGYEDRPSSIHRMIDVPAWESIEANYHHRTRAALVKLMLTRPVKLGGKLILWHGQPGTGKTWALRALARAWSDWISVHYITDPEHFFGQSAGYMQTVILGRGQHDYDAEDEHDIDRRKTDWRLLIMEDTGELLTKDAKQQLGQGLSRLLNVCDGLIGQGLRVMVLITTNEDLGVMHPAVTRAGRCLANIKFDALSQDEVMRWASEHEVAMPLQTGVLADLYSGSDSPVHPGRIGFRAPPGEIEPARN
jgi:hypothetical protein